MERRHCNNEELISELHRFVRENGRTPKATEMTPKNGYPSYSVYKSRFGSWNNALKVANLEFNKKHHIGELDGTETCSYCGKRADEIPNHIGWRYDKEGNRFCNKHGHCGYKEKPDYVIGTLDINSSTGRGRAGEILAVKTLGIGKEHDYNRISCGFKFDIYHEKYGKIDVKTSLHHFSSNSWSFNFKAKKEADTYICIGFSSDRKKVDHVWIVPNEDKIRNLTGLTITNSFSSLLKNNKYEVDSKPYDDMLCSMSLDKCNSMIDKKKMETKEEKQKFE